MAIKNLYIPIDIEICRDNVEFPRSTKDSKGLYIYAHEEDTITAGMMTPIYTGLKFTIPDGYTLKVCSPRGLHTNTPLRIREHEFSEVKGEEGALIVWIGNTTERQISRSNYPWGSCDYNEHRKWLASLHEFRPTFPVKDEIDYKARHSINEKGNIPGNYVIQKGDTIARAVIIDKNTSTMVPFKVKTIGSNN